jgi:hypothetical protein
MVIHFSGGVVYCLSVSLNPLVYPSTKGQVSDIPIHLHYTYS